MLTLAEYNEWVLPRHQEIAERVNRAEALLILYINNGAHLLDASLESGVDVLSLDWPVDLADTARRHGKRVALQGNMDPSVLAARAEKIASMVRDLARDAAPARGYIANLGHGCVPGTPVEGVRELPAALQSL